MDLKNKKNFEDKSQVSVIKEEQKEHLAHLKSQHYELNIDQSHEQTPYISPIIAPGDPTLLRPRQQRESQNNQNADPSHNNHTPHDQMSSRLTPKSFRSGITTNKQKKPFMKLKSKQGTQNLGGEDFINKSQRSYNTSQNQALNGFLSIPNEEALIYQNRGVGETQITFSENRVTENLGDSYSPRQTEFLRVFEYQNENNLLTKDKGRISDFRSLLSETYIIPAQINNGEDPEQDQIKQNLENKRTLKLQWQQQQENPFFQGLTDAGQSFEEKDGFHGFTPANEMVTVSFSKASNLKQHQQSRISGNQKGRKQDGRESPRFTEAAVSHLLIKQENFQNQQAAACQQKSIERKDSTIKLTFQQQPSSPIQQLESEAVDIQIVQKLSQMSLVHIGEGDEGQNNFDEEVGRSNCDNADYLLHAIIAKSCQIKEPTGSASKFIKKNNRSLSIRGEPQINGIADKPSSNPKKESNNLLLKISSMPSGQLQIGNRKEIFSTDMRKKDFFVLDDSKNIIIEASKQNNFNSQLLPFQKELSTLKNDKIPELRNLEIADINNTEGMGLLSFKKQEDENNSGTKQAKEETQRHFQGFETPKSDRIGAQDVKFPNRDDGRKDSLSEIIIENQNLENIDHQSSDIAKKGSAITAGHHKCIGTYVVKYDKRSLFIFKEEWFLRQLII